MVASFAIERPGKAPLQSDVAIFAWDPMGTRHPIRSPSWSISPVHSSHETTSRAASTAKARPYRDAPISQASLATVPASVIVAWTKLMALPVVLNRLIQLCHSSMPSKESAETLPVVHGP
jgi:hypothetical protein